MRQNYNFITEYQVVFGNILKENQLV